jgi:hypothetical protein
MKPWMLDSHCDYIRGVGVRGTEAVDDSPASPKGGDAKGLWR